MTLRDDASLLFRDAVSDMMDLTFLSVFLLPSIGSEADASTFVESEALDDCEELLFLMAGGGRGGAIRMPVGVDVGDVEGL